MKINLLLPAGLIGLLVIAVPPMRANCQDKSVEPTFRKESATKPQSEKIVSPALLKELKIYSREVDSLNIRDRVDANDEWKLKIINIYFEQRDLQRYIMLSPSVAYISNTMIGHFMLDDKLVTVYNDNQDTTICNDDIVRMSKLQKGRPPGQFRDRASLNPWYKLDVEGKRFKVKDNGELEFDSYVW